ncbi:ATP-binding protein [Vagococcus sp. PNs007]|uniref:histidine kinase n=1 Tax=Vagococcus proximus TaxID=2991417 RepID=A0ABT5WZ45_9ENTE|nr:ATP-binding protein [Vagococcus proximus]MDF0479033.1 ATP-binding protein [Vagococcus proximus]
MRKKGKLLTGLVLLVLMASVSYFFSNRYVTHQLYDQHKYEMLDEANVILRATAIRDWTVSPPENQQAIIRAIARENKQRISVLSAEGRVVFDTGETLDTESEQDHANRPEIAAVIDGSKLGADLRLSQTLHEDYYYIAIPITSKSGDLVGILRLSENAKHFTKNVHYFQKILLSLLGLFVLLMILLVINVLYYQNRKDKEITDALIGIQEKRYTSQYLLMENGHYSTLGRIVRDLAEEMEQQSQDFYLSEKRFEELLDQLNIGVMLVSPSRTIVMANPTVTRIFGWQESVLGSDYVQHIPIAELFEPIEKVFETGDLIRQNMAINERYYDVKITPITEGHGTHQLMLLFHDITDIQNVLKHQNDFISNVSHELKTPVTAIKGFSETLIDGALDDPAVATDFLTIILNESLRLENLIEDILSLSRLTDRVKNEATAFSLVTVVEKLEKKYNLTLKKKELDFIFELTGSPDVILDYHKVYRLVDNLVSNSIKYTLKQGKVQVTISGDDEMITLVVSDNGMGIAPEEQQRIFERFYRVDKARTSDIKGTGLGLAIVKELVEQLDGELELESQLNKGTCITIHLPRKV